MTASRWAVPAVVALGAALRLLRAATRWEGWAWRYSAYPADVVDALQHGDLGEALTRFSGLHPPLWPLLHAAGELLLPVPALWLLAGALWGSLGVALVARRWPLAGLVLATSPVALHYTAEVNDYPLLFGLVCAVWGARDAVAAGRASWGWLALAGALAGWTHALGGVVAGVAALSLERRLAARVLAALATAALPLVPGVVGILGDEPTVRQPPFQAGLVAADLLERFGPGGLLLLPLAALGVRRAPAVAAGLVAPALVLAGLVAAGIAAPHQFPYLVVLVVPFALLADAGATGTWPRRGLLVLALGQGLLALGHEGAKVGAIATDPPGRAIDLALDELETPWTCPGEGTPACAGDALVLVEGGGGNDDDKRRSSPVFWRLRPWWPMPRLVGAPGDWDDPRRGQPRLVRGHAVYAFAHVRPELAEVLALHPRVRLVVSGDGPRQRFLDELEALVGQRPAPVGPDHLLRLP